MSISSDGTVFNINERCMYFTDEKPLEPLCWEEQLNSSQVKLLNQREPTMANDCYKEIDTQPVVFYQKNLVEKMLKQQKMRFHLTSCNLPKLQKMEKRTTNSDYNSSGNLSSRGRNCKQLKNNANKKASVNDRLELKGNGMESSRRMNEFVNGNGHLPGHCDTNYHKKMFGKDQFFQDRDNVQSRRSHSLMDLSSDNYRPISNKTLFKHTQYVDIPVSLPNPTLTDESSSIVSEGKDYSNSEIISLGAKAEKVNKTSNEEKNASNERSPYNIDKSEMKFVMPVEISCNDLGKGKFPKSESNTNPRFTPRLKSRENRQPSRLTYTPSTTPLFLSEEIYELPKGVSPSKALSELRQTFCENIRKETEQLEFDLQQLYLKKQLHQR